MITVDKTPVWVYNAHLTHIPFDAWKANALYGREDDPDFDPEWLTPELWQEEQYTRAHDAWVRAIIPASMNAFSLYRCHTEDGRTGIHLLTEAGERYSVFQAQERENR